MYVSFVRRKGERSAMKAAQSSFARLERSTTKAMLIGVARRRRRLKTQHTFHLPGGNAPQ